MLKNGKVAGGSAIRAKILKSGCGLCMRCNLFNICATSIPDNWKNAGFCPLYIKKGKKNGVKSGDALLHAPEKVFGRFLIGRI